MITINEALKQHAPFSISALIGVMLFLTLLLCIKQWHEDWLTAHQQVTNNITLNKDETALLIAAIPETHLFGKNFSKNGLPITNLQLHVTGIVKIDDEENNSKAYISMSGQPSKIYHVGDALPYGVKVYDITPDAVILENDGQLEKLPLPREKLNFKQRGALYEK